MKNKTVDNSEKKTKEFPRYLSDIRVHLILQLDDKGLSLQNIATLLSYGISKGRVFQIIKEHKNK